MSEKENHLPEIRHNHEEKKLYMNFPLILELKNRPQKRNDLDKFKIDWRLTDLCDEDYFAWMNSLLNRECRAKARAMLVRKFLIGRIENEDDLRIINSRALEWHIIPQMFGVRREFFVYNDAELSYEVLDLCKRLKQRWVGFYNDKGVAHGYRIAVAMTMWGEITLMDFIEGKGLCFNRERVLATAQGKLEKQYDKLLSDGTKVPTTWEGKSPETKPEFWDALNEVFIECGKS